MRLSALSVGFALLALTNARTAELEPIRYTIAAPAPETQMAEIEAIVPTDGRATIDLMMAAWSPGFYRVENYATRVSNFSARGPDGVSLAVDRPTDNRWRITTGGRARITIAYKLTCKERSVSTNWVHTDFGVFTGPATFITLVENVKRPHEVRLTLPAAWSRSASGLPAPPGGGANAYRAPDFEMLADSPILAGNLGVEEFTVDGKRHQVVSAGEVGTWDARRAAADLQNIVTETRRFWGFELPYQQYAFLLMFRQGGGGLEHKDSALVTSSPTMGGSAEAYRRWLGLMSHEYFHAFNVKRLRPVELGPFDFEHAPTTTSLWFSEGVTSYYGNLMLRRAGLGDNAEQLASLSSQIGQLQKSPGRLLQTLEQSSAEVWNNSLSGVNAAPTTVSYYGKGLIVGFLLDAHIRHTTNDQKSFDDVMRLAYSRFGGERGFTADQLRATADTVAGVDLKAWFGKALGSTDELDYTEALEWFGLSLSSEWQLEERPDATPAQQAHLKSWLTH
ncbi:MAG: hypothetical protein ABI665_26910 [Vicinamibacterales bacterium]